MWLELLLAAFDAGCKLGLWLELLLAPPAKLEASAPMLDDVAHVAAAASVSVLTLCVLDIRRERL